jgi:allophanate hydrolase subunit 2
LESEAWPGAVSKSEFYSGTGSLQAWRVEGASVRALLRLRGPRVERSRGGETTCDGWVAGSHTIAHGDVEF